MTAIYKKTTLRKFSQNDIPFMYTLYASTRESELALTNFTVQEKQNFIQQQFDAQLHHYTQHYCSDAFNIIEIEEKPIGRLFVDYWKNEIRVVDIALLPDFRQQGIGTFYFNQLFKEAKKSEKPVSIHVEHNNPAKKLYERLGFKFKSQTNEIYLLMEWQP